MKPKKKKVGGAAVLDQITASPDKERKARFVSSGSTLFNLALTGSPHRGFREGSYYNIIGDSSSGKTFVCLTVFAEAMLDPYFKNFDLYHDNVEDGALMDLGKFFGKEVERRAQLPGIDRETGEPCPSSTVESFYDNANKICDKGRPFIYVLDSENMLTSESENKTERESRKLRDKGADSKGSYGDGKAKYHSTHLRALCRRVKRCGGILIIISQTRDNIDPFSMEKKTRAGGRALKFYATAEVWTAVKKSITVKVREKSRQVGVLSVASVKKNRVNGKVRSADIRIYYESGIDDTLASINWLLEEGHWKKKNGIIEAKEFEFSGKERELAAHIDDTGKRRALAEIVGDVWDSIERACAIRRKPKYA